jgi:hypothetical protein
LGFRGFAAFVIYSGDRAVHAQIPRLWAAVDGLILK